MKIRAHKDILLFVLGTIVLIGVCLFVLQQSGSTTPFASQLREPNGNPVADGHYDLRVVGYDTITGEKTTEQQFSDVFVQNGSYEIPVNLGDFSSTGQSIIQVCRTEQATQDKDGIRGTAPQGCKDPVEQQQVFTYAECAQYLSIGGPSGFLSTLRGDRTAVVTGACLYGAEAKQDGTPIPVAPSAASSPSIVAVKGIKGDQGVQGQKGDKGDPGEPGVPGQDGERGPQGAQGNPGVQGPAGSPASDDQTLSFNGLSVLTISGGNSVNLASLLDNTDTLTSLSCGAGQVAQWSGAIWVCASAAVDTDDQTLTLSSNNLSIDNGNSVSLLAYLDNTDSQSLFLTIDAPNGTDPTADSTTDTLAFADGAGITITGNSTTDTLTIASVLGTAIDTTEITNGTILFEDLASNSCSSGQVIEFNGSAWVCATDNDSGAPSEASIEAFIFDGDNTGTLSSGTLALGSLSYTGTLSDTNVSDALTISSSGSVADGALSANVSLLGTAIDSTEITNGTILFADLASNSCSSGQIIEYNGSNWVCGSDDGITAEVDGSTTNELQNIFETIATPAGTNPVADGTTDTLSFANGSGVTITGNGTTDTITIAATLGTDITTTEIVDSTITADDLATGSVESAEILNGTIVLADFSNFGCSSGQIIEYNGSNWVCASDDVNDADADATNELQSLFLTIDAPNGTDPTADSTTDTLAFADGAGITITGNSTTDTLTIASVLGTAIDTTEITNGTILFEDLASNSCSSGQVIEFNGSAWVCATDNDSGAPSEASIEAFIFDGDNTGTLSSGTLALGSLSYTGTLSDTNVSDALTIGATSTVSDSALSSNVSLLGATIESSEITNNTIVGGDVANDTFNFSELSDSLSLDAATTISAGASNFIINLDGGGDFIAQDNGTSAFQIQDNGNVYIGDPASAIATGSLLVLDQITADPGTATNGAMYYNSSTGKFRCYEASTWKDCISAPASENDITTTYRFFTELTGNATTAAPDVFTVNNGTGAATATSALNLSANRPGLYRATTGTTATGRTAFGSGTSTFVLGSGSVVYETAVNITTLSALAERYQFVVGLMDTQTAANQVDAVAFVYDEGGVSTGSTAGGNWQIVTSSNSTRTWTTTTTAVAAATWYKLRVEVNAAGTSATFYINGALVGTHATNIPTGTTRALGFGQLLIKSAGTTARTVDLDYIRAQKDFTVAR